MSDGERLLDLVGIALVGVLAPGGDALLAGAIRRAVVRTLVVTPIWLAAIEIDHRDRVVGHYSVAPVVRRIVQVTNQSANVMNAT